MYCVFSPIKRSKVIRRSIEVQSKEMVIVIKDDGKGIPHELIEQPTGNGLHNMQKRLAGMGGRLKIENKVGTTVVFTIPLKQPSHQSTIDH